MSVEENKAAVTQLMALLTAGDIEGALDLMANDGKWWVGGKADKFALAGYKSKDEMRTLLNNLIGPMPNGLQMRLKTMIGEDDRVAAEVESYGEAGNGRLYNNEYHFLFVLHDGKFVEVKEYLDTMHVQGVFLDA